MTERPVGKKAEPTIEELEFIYEHLPRLSDQEILEEMQDTEFPLRSLGFIKRRRREFNAAKKVLQTQLEKAVDPIATKRREEHFQKLTQIANELIADNLNTLVTKPRQGDNLGEPRYFIRDSGWDSPYYPIAKEELISRLEHNLEMVRSEYTDRVFIEHFLPHLHAEIPDIESSVFWDKAQEKPSELIDTLILMAERKTFKGTCPVCEGW